LAGTRSPTHSWGPPTVGSHTQLPLTTGPVNSVGPGRLALKQLSANAVVIGSARRTVIASPTTTIIRRSMRLFLSAEPTWKPRTLPIPVATRQGRANAYDTPAPRRSTAQTRGGSSTPTLTPNAARL